jgi:hypothetical protein
VLAGVPAVLVLVAALLLVVTGARGQGTGGPAGVRFVAVDVFVDSGATPLAAYQVEIRELGAAGGTPAPQVRLVGVEGGAGVYATAPYYDPAALHAEALKDRIVIAAFSTGAGLPTGKSRVARLHMEVRGGEPGFAMRVMTAGAADGHKIEATATCSPADAGPGDGR